MRLVTNTSGMHQSWEAPQLLLPTRQVLWLVSYGRTVDIELYTSQGRANSAWAPTITNVPRTLARGNSYQISGTQFNGLSCSSD